MGTPAKDVGLGTAYERWAIYDRLARWLAPAPATALEGPVDGMAGMPGLHLLPLARRGTRVTVVLPDAAALDRVARVYGRAGLADRLEAIEADAPPADRTFEAVLAFNFACEVADWRGHLAAQAAASERWLVVFATHPASYGVYLSRLLRRGAEPRAPALFEHEASQPSVMRAALGAHGRVVEERFVDCPWWPDLFVSAGETLWSKSTGRAPRPTPHDSGPDDFPFAEADRPSALRRALRRHPTFDRAPPPVAGLFAHHRAYLVRRPHLSPLDGSGGGPRVP